METKFINNLRINLNTIPQSGSTRAFTITGDVGANFMLIVARSDSQYYNFSTNTFSLGHSALKTLKGTINGLGFNGSIAFPNVGGVDYKVMLTPDPSDNTEMKRGSAIIKKISALSDTTLTISVDSTDHTASFKTLPTDLTSVGSINVASLKAISFTIENAATDANGFGLFFNNTLNNINTIINESAWYFQQNQTVNGDASSTTSIVLDSVVDLAVGMTLFSGTGLSGTPIIQSVDASTNTIVLSTAQSIDDDVVLTFRAIGLSLINSVLGCSISSGLAVSSVLAPTTTVRGANNDDAVVEVNGTRGIPGGDVVFLKGVSVTKATVTANRTNGSTATASAAAGELTTSVNQTFKGGETLTFAVTDRTTVLFISAIIAGTLTITKRPSVDRLINLNLDAIIDPGVQA